MQSAASNLLSCEEAERERADDGGDKEARTRGRAVQSAVVFDFELVHGIHALTIPT